MVVRYGFERRKFLVKQLAEIAAFDSLLDDLEQAAMLSRVPYGIPLSIRWQNIELSAYLFEPSGTEGKTLLVEKVRKKKIVTPSLVVNAG